MKRFLFLLLILAGVCNAVQKPTSSKFDKRMQYLAYNGYNVTQINAKVGYVTAINFSQDEVIVDVVIGFNLGWETTDNNNKIFLKPMAYKYEDMIVEPNSAEWDTNLIVTTNKRIYTFDLKLVDSDDNSYLVNFTYPADERNKKQALLKEQKALEQEKLANDSLEQFTQPKNWNYTMLVGKDSESITPDFTYDDGVRTFIGFTSEKTIPAIFYYQGKQEMMSNTSVKNTEKYTIIVVHKTASRFILRSGEEVVGIVNKSFGKSVQNNQVTSNKDIIRNIK